MRKKERLPIRLNDLNRADLHLSLAHPDLCRLREERATPAALFEEDRCIKTPSSLGEKVVQRNEADMAAQYR